MKVIQMHAAASPPLGEQPLVQHGSARLKV
jgi:hypothetical protein